MGASAPIMFLDTIGDSPRFSYVPQFWESTLPSGNGFLHVLRFKSTWLQATWWKKGGTTKAFHPGEAGPSDLAGGQLGSHPDFRNRLARSGATDPPTRHPRARRRPEPIHT